MAELPLAHAVEVSVIVPVHDNATTLTMVIERIVDAFAPTACTFEIVAVDDRSGDDSWTILEALAKADRRVRAIRLASNGGAGTAKGAGCAVARGRFICTIDADLDYEPADILAVVTELRRGHDLVGGVRVVEGARPISRDIGTKLMRWMVSRLWSFTPTDLGCGIHGWTAEVAASGLPHLGTQRDFAWAVPLFMTVDSYCEVEVGYSDVSPSSYTTYQLVGRLASLARAVVLTKVPNMARILGSVALGSSLLAVGRRNRRTELPIWVLTALGTSAGFALVRQRAQPPILIERVAGDCLSPGLLPDPAGGVAAIGT